MSMDVSQQHLIFNGALGLEPMECGLWFFSGHLFEFSLESNTLDSTFWLSLIVPMVTHHQAPSRTHLRLLCPVLMHAAAAFI